MDKALMEGYSVKNLTHDEQMIFRGMKAGAADVGEAINRILLDDDISEDAEKYSFVLHIEDKIMRYLSDARDEYVIASQDTQ